MGCPSSSRLTRQAGQQRAQPWGARQHPALASSLLLVRSTAQGPAFLFPATAGAFMVRVWLSGQAAPRPGGTFTARRAVLTRPAQGGVGAGSVDLASSKASRESFSPGWRRAGDPGARHPFATHGAELLHLLPVRLEAVLAIPHAQPTRAPWHSWLILLGRGQKVRLSWSSEHHGIASRSAPEQWGVALGSTQTASLSGCWCPRVPALSTQKLSPVPPHLEDHRP